MTAKEFLLKEVPYHIKQEGFSFGDINSKIIEKAMIEFARYHVKEALIVAFEDVPIGGSDNINYEDVAIIKNRYPLEKIK